MSPINSIGVLAFASAVLAVPHINHQHLHKRGAASAYPASYSAPSYNPSVSFPYPSASAYPYGTGTGYYGTGYAQPTGYSLCTAYTSTYIWRSSTSVTTIYISPTPYSAAAAAAAATVSCEEEAAYSASLASAAAAAASQCYPDVTITTNAVLTITVTAGAYNPATSAAAPVYSAPAAPVYSAPAAPVYSAPAAPVYSAPAAPVSSAPAAPVYSAPAAKYESYAPSVASSAAAPAYSGSAAPWSGKRGLAYNDASLTEPFLGSSKIGWGYNWGSTSNGLSSSISYIPELHTLEFSGTWLANAKAGIASGSKYLFSLNEPDMVSQANLSPEAAAAAWKTYMEPFAGQATLVAPAVTNSQSPGEGLDWLKQFFAACYGCNIGAINQHWYDSTSNDLDFFKQQISSASEFGLPIFVGEFGFIGSDEDISSALTEAMSYLDANDDVIGYAYYFVSDGLLVDGDSPSSYGSTYGW